MSLRRYRKQNSGITLQLLGPTSSKPENFLHKNMLSHTSPYLSVKTKRLKTFLLIVFSQGMKLKKMRLLLVVLL